MSSQHTQISTTKKLKLVFGVLYKLSFVGVIALMLAQIFFRRVGFYDSAAVLGPLGLLLVLLTFLCLIIYGLLCVIKDKDSEIKDKQ